jgi:hypothetical protein
LGFGFWDLPARLLASAATTTTAAASAAATTTAATESAAAPTRLHRPRLVHRQRPSAEALFVQLGDRVLRVLSVAISTNAKPRARPVSRSRITFTVATLPAFANNAVKSSSLVSYGMLPT